MLTVCCSWCVAQLLLQWFVAASELGFAFIAIFVQPSAMFSSNSFQLTINLTTVAAVFFAQLVRALWYNERMPWGHRMSTNYLLSGVACDTGLTLLLQGIMR